jgi:signal transduction histidine kinase
MSFDVNHICKNGTVKPMHVFARLIDWKNQKVGLSVSADLTEHKKDEEERKKLLEQLFQSQKLESIGNLAGGVAHDFNNMLGIIIGYAELSLCDMDPSNPLKENLEKIYNAATQSANLTRQLLTFARKQAIMPEILDLNETVESILKILRRLIGENIDLSWLPSSEHCSIKIDRSQIEQILMNLCMNARDAIKDVGKIIIKTEVTSFTEDYCTSNTGFIPGNYIMLSVSDDGAGMDKDIKNHIFEPFFTTKGIGKGTGLGLSTVYGIVKQNNGFINVYSEPGIGTVFNIYFSMYSGETADKEIINIEVPQSQGETILVIEDDFGHLQMTVTMLDSLGYNVIHAGTPGEAIRLFAETSEINLFITDVIMPEMNGKELADKLLAIRPGIKHLFMSGYTADIIVHKGILDESVNLIHKPFSLRDLAVKVREALK